MIVTMQANIQPSDRRVLGVMDKAREFGLNPEPLGVGGKEYIVTQVLLKDGAAVKSSSVAQHFFERLDGVETVQRVTPPSVSLAHNGNRNYHRIQIGSVSVGTELPCRLVAGPCTVDTRVGEVIGNLKQLGIRRIRGGCWKPRSGPNSFPGFGEKAVRWLLEAARNHNMEAVFLEVIESDHIEIVRKTRDAVGYKGTIVFWVGARTGNPILLRKLGEQGEFPVMLKNGLGDEGIDNLSARAEWVLARNSVWDENGQLVTNQSLTPGNSRLIFCLRGTKKTDKHSQLRFTPNYQWAENIQRIWWTPVAMDPSHIAGEERFVLDNVDEALRFNPSLIMVEGGYSGDGFRGLCDMDQSLSLDNMAKVIAKVTAHNRRIYRTRTF